YHKYSPDLPQCVPNHDFLNR
ncbi:hypothetical protein CP082626L3_0943B, partial [Chlamydia psittaci 08-2626_L3]